MTRVGTSMHRAARQIYAPTGCSYNLLGSPVMLLQAAGTYESVTNFASAAARQSSKQIASLGEASWRYVSSQYSLWRSPHSPRTGKPDGLSVQKQSK